MPKAPTERVTRQKRAIRDVFELAGSPLSIEDVLVSAQEKIASLGVATVYRSIRSLIDEGFLQAVDLPGRLTLYERADKGHHHHFLCTGCETVYELDACTTEVKGELPPGFRATGHDVTIYGTCRTCAQAKRPAARKTAKAR
jgi:Fur family transcriptional regulator, ferric uptake regulator